MTRDDWTLILVRLLGLYLIATHLGTFITAISTLILVISQSPNNLHNMPITTWQAPIITTVGLAAGWFFVAKARVVASMLQKADKK